MLSEFLGANEFQITHPVISELRQALKNMEGRSYRILS